MESRGCSVREKDKELLPVDNCSDRAVLDNGVVSFDRLSFQKLVYMQLGEWPYIRGSEFLIH